MKTPQEADNCLKGDVDDLLDAKASLLRASFEGHHTYVLELLQSHGAATDAKALMIAAECGHKEVVEILVEFGAFVDEPLDGLTPLFVASREGRVSVVVTLLWLGAAVDGTCNAGQTPLSIAAEEGHVAVVEALLACGASINQAADNGTTPLLAAAEKGHIPVLEALIARGADVALTKRPDCLPPCMVAYRHGHEAVAELLRLRARTAAAKCLLAAARAGHFDQLRMAVANDAAWLPLDEWTVLLPPAAFIRLASWVSSSLAAQRSCFACLFGSERDEWRKPMLHRIVQGKGRERIRQRVTAFLVHRSEVARALLREMAAFGIVQKQRLSFFPCVGY